MPQGEVADQNHGALLPQRDRWLPSLYSFEHHPQSPSKKKKERRESISTGNFCIQMSFSYQSHHLLSNLMGICEVLTAEHTFEKVEGKCIRLWSREEGKKLIVTWHWFLQMKPASFELRDELWDLTELKHCYVVSSVSGYVFYVHLKRF